MILGSSSEPDVSKSQIFYYWLSGYDKPRYREDIPSVRWTIFLPREIHLFAYLDQTRKNLWEKFMPLCKYIEAYIGYLTLAKILLVEFTVI